MIRKELKALASLAWPLLIAQVTHMLMGVSDTIMAGRVSPEDLAAVAVASSIIFPVLFFLQGIVLALPPIVSRYRGAGNHQPIAAAMFNTAYTALLLCLPVLACGALLPWVESVLAMKPATNAIVTDYLGYMLWGVPSFVLYQVFRNLAEGLSLTRPSMVIMVVGLLVNIPANYVFIYGKLGMPALGGAGCGIATALVFTVMAIASAIYTVKAKKLAPYKLFAQFHRPDKQGMQEVIKIGLPIALSILFEVSLFSLVAILLSPFGADTVASHQVALNFSSLMFMIPLSLGMATTIRVGQKLGEESLDGAMTAVKSAWLMGALISLFTASMSVLMRYPIAQMYTNDTLVIEMAASLMLLAALFQFSDAMQVISGCALRGYKDTRAMLLITLFSYWGVGLSTGCILGLTNWVVPAMAAKGFWIGFIVGLSAAAVLLTLRLRWLNRQGDIPHIDEVTP